MIHFQGKAGMFQKFSSFQHKNGNVLGNKQVNILLFAKLVLPFTKLTSNGLN